MGMLDEKALILIAHSDRRTLMALYTLLDREGYFIAPCFSPGELIQNCAQYKPELVLTSNPLPGNEGAGLLETLKERFPNIRVLLLPEGLSQGSGGAPLEPLRTEESLRTAGARPVPYPPPAHRNGF